MTKQVWGYFNPVRVVYEPESLGDVFDGLGFKRVALVTSPGFSRRGVVDDLRKALGERLLAVLDDVRPNPDVVDIDTQAQRLRELRPDCMLALGGGSSMDTAKALARLLAQDDGVTLAAHFRDGAKMGERAALPVVTIPSTSGTGSEVTPFATVWDFGKGKKYSVAGEDVFPALSILMPRMALGAPEEVTISSGLDAVSHAFESAWNRHASPVTLGFVAKSLQLSLRALPRLKENPDDLAARGAMMQASLLAGLAISQTRTALAHSISYPLTTAFNLPHGIACSFTLPALLRFNAGADDGRLADLANVLGCSSVEMLAERLQTLFDQLGVGTLFERYVSDADAVLALADEMFTPGRADNNLRSATIGDVKEIVRNSLAVLRLDSPGSDGISR